jgi:hypothetical protein
MFDCNQTQIYQVLGNQKKLSHDKLTCESLYRNSPFGPKNLTIFGKE